MGFVVEPAWSFTIPSLADDTPLDCRIYHPPHFEAVLANAAENGHATRGAIIAHPYAPLGGNYDDAVVLALVKCLLREGFVVGTFNFRYVLPSQTVTSNMSLTESAEEQPAQKEALAGLAAWRKKTTRPSVDSSFTIYKNSSQVTTATTATTTMADPGPSQLSCPHAPRGSMIPKATTTPSPFRVQYPAHEELSPDRTTSPSSCPATPTAL